LEAIAGIELEDVSYESRKVERCSSRQTGFTSAKYLTGNPKVRSEIIKI
jgi:hypothetical protein